MALFDDSGGGYFALPTIGDPAPPHNGDSSKPYLGCRLSGGHFANGMPMLVAITTQILSDKQKRQIYDQYGEAGLEGGMGGGGGGFGGGGFHDPMDIFNQFFGGGGGGFPGFGGGMCSSACWMHLALYFSHYFCQTTTPARPLPSLYRICPFWLS